MTMTVTHNGSNCVCDCHNSPGTPCSMVGGCGTTWSAPVTIIDTVGGRITPTDFVALDGTQACVLGCTTRTDHKPGCPCHTQCPQHESHCDGCAPRPAYQASLLCGSCFYRKLRSPLRRVPALVDWLVSRKAGLKAAVYDGDKVSGSHEVPLPFNAAIVDHISVLNLLLNAWAYRALREAPPERGVAITDATVAAEWLDDHAAWVSGQPWVVELIRHLRELEARARTLAPWQVVRHRLPLPCMKCEQTTLVLFGGDDWVTCTNTDCDEIIGWSRYQNLSRAISRLYENKRQDVG